MDDWVIGEDRRLKCIAGKRRLTYRDIEPLIEYIVAVKCAKFGTIGIYGRDDVAQEIRAKCYKILRRFNHKAGGAFNFFGSCADNFLRDLRRKHTLRKTNVCSRCVYYRHGNCFLYAAKPEKCKRFSAYLTNKQRKENITKMICDPEFPWHMQPSTTCLFDNENYYEAAILDIRNALPSGLVYVFDMLMANSGVAKDTEEVLFERVKSVIKDAIDW